MGELNNNIFNNNIAGDTSNILIPDNSAIKKGIVFKSNIDSNVLNGFYNILSKAIQYLQFTVGLYSKEADYNEGNIASLVIKNNENYSIWQFKRNSNNPQVLNNNPPISGASITRVNGVDAYEGGTLNTDWDKLTEDYDVEATPNTVMIRDEEGASNVNMPSNIENTTAVNNEYLQTELSKKQDKLTAGINVEITEDNVINVQGDISTVASQVTQTNEALGANVQIALNNLKTKDDSLQNSINTETAQRTQADSDLLTQIGILIPRYMIPPYYMQYPDTNGNFNSNEEPSMWFKKMYGVTTTWQIMFNTESTFFRTEGDLASVGRSNGIQGDAGRNATGTFIADAANVSGIYYSGSFRVSYITEQGYGNMYNIASNLSRAYTTANEFRVKNRLIRVYKLLTINGKTIAQIMEGA